MYMNGIRALRIIAFLSISIGIGILTRGAWGFVAFGILVLIDNFVFPSRHFMTGAAVENAHL